MTAMNWTAGYVAEIDYTYGYYRDLSPSLMRVACLSAGLVPPVLERLTYLELGFGQGLSVNIHAAANEGHFWGTDFNPTQAARAGDLALASGSGATLLNDLFAELAARSDLPEFDIIALHGIWSWISDENRQIIVDLLRRKLKVGGIAYVSYNCLPGWAAAMPLRHLIMLHAELAGSEALGIVGKIDGALKFAQQVVDSGAHYFRANPAVAQHLKQIAGQDRRYLAHEYFNLDWDVMAFSDVAKTLQRAKLTFAASANLIDHVEAINLSETAHKLLAEIKQPLLYQSIRDYFVNQQFRRDIFVKGRRSLTSLERSEAFHDQAFVLVTNPDEITMKVTGSLGEVMLQEKIYGPIIEVLAEENLSPKTFGQLSVNRKLSAITSPHLTEAILVLIGAGYLHTAQEPTKLTNARCAALNGYLYERARDSDAVSFLASPITGSGIVVPRSHQLFLLAMQQGKKLPPDQAAFVWNLVSTQGQRVIKEGRPLEAPEDNLAELTRQAVEFAEKHLLKYRALGVQ